MVLQSPVTVVRKAWGFSREVSSRVLKYIWALGLASWLPTGSFMGSYKWGYKSPNMAYNCGYPSYNSTCMGSYKSPNMGYNYSYPTCNWV